MAHGLDPRQEIDFLLLQMTRLPRLCLDTYLGARTLPCGRPKKNRHFLEQQHALTAGHD